MTLVSNRGQFQIQKCWVAKLKKSGGRTVMIKGDGTFIKCPGTGTYNIFGIRYRTRHTPVIYRGICHTGVRVGIVGMAFDNTSSSRDGRYRNPEIPGYRGYRRYGI